MTLRNTVGRYIIIYFYQDLLGIINCDLDRAYVSYLASISQFTCDVWNEWKKTHDISWCIEIISATMLKQDLSTIVNMAFLCQTCIKEKNIF